MKKRSAGRSGRGNWIRGIAMGAGTSILSTILIAALFAVLTEKQTVWKGMPGYYMTAIPAITLSLPAGLILGRWNAGTGANPVSLAIGGIYFLILLAMHAAFSQASGGVVMTFVLCMGLSAASCILGNRKKSQNRSYFKGF